MDDSTYSLGPNENTQELHYYLFVVNLDTCVRSCNTLKDLYNKVYTSNKTEDINLCFQNCRNKWIENINKSSFDGRKFNSNQKWNIDKCWCECKNLGKKFMLAKKIISGIMLHVVAKMINI